MLGESPERDHDIEQLQTLIRNCAAAGIPAIKYNLLLVGVLADGACSGERDCTYSAWRLADAPPRQCNDARRPCRLQTRTGSV